MPNSFSMIRILFLFTFNLMLIPIYAQNWTNEQLEKANTARNVSYLTNTEKECIMYINLCRLYPQDFLRNEVLTYKSPQKYSDYLKNSPYFESLIQLLNSMNPVGAVNFDQQSYSDAKCFVIEQGKAGTTGHTRINCSPVNYAECCSYGMETSKDIVMQLLIDHDVPSLGHRINCLNKSYSKIGVSIQPHTKWGTCAVIDMIW